MRLRVVMLWIYPSYNGDSSGNGFGEVLEVFVKEGEERWKESGKTMVL